MRFLILFEEDTYHQLLIIIMSMSSETESEEKAEHHLELNNKYLDEAEVLIKRKDYVQTSEKLWGAAAEIVKVVAAKRGMEIKSHRELYKFVANLRMELEELELTRLFAAAGALHQNFYENWLPSEVVIDYAEAVKELVAKLRRTI